MVLSYQFFTFSLNLNICFTEIIDCALDATRTFNICKLLRTFFLVHQLSMPIGIDLHWRFDSYPSIG